ncbi:DUF4179 domain-containing protein [Paenibacillus sp. MMS18-CY102]|uniref:DUF4179 domain-containing protein n=1 Tax=Paenibacillus sp. MMS18-CY102 TaxID=2682849 RepID=UPI0013656853|nr:DUF4179 domain-containing protein [Paenibacillus sp. MMS18-CY102]MWC27114.1 DUF4179 domain-containing protein [Paenibacillus sp. MMS18-CY102]
MAHHEGQEAKEHQTETALDPIEAAIMAGIRKGEQQLKRRRRLLRKRWSSVAIMSMLLVVCLLAIRVSPAVAAVARDIPGLALFVDLINRESSDRGIGLALDNDFVQPVGVADEHDGLKLSIEGIIADDSRLVMLYAIKPANEGETVVRIDQPRLSDVSGKHLPAAIGYSENQEIEGRDSGIQRGTIDIQLAEGTAMPEAVVLKLSLLEEKQEDSQNANAAGQRAGEESLIGTEGTPLEGKLGSQQTTGTHFTVKVPIDRELSRGRQHEYNIGQTVVIEGQELTFTKAVVSPLSLKLYVSYDEANAKQIFDAGDMRILDDEGTEWHMISGGNGSLNKDGRIYHFESPYFKEPKSLTVAGSWFRALDRNKLNITVDTDKGQLLRAPDGKLELSKVMREAEYTKLDFALGGLDPADQMMYSLLEGTFTDGAGKEHSMANLQQVMSGYTVNGSEEREKQHLLYYLNRERYPQPLTFTIFGYPMYIREPYSIRIK